MNFPQTIIKMYLMFIVLLVLLNASVVVAKPETNAQRMAKGLPLLPPSKFARRGPTPVLSKSRLKLRNLALKLFRFIRTKTCDTIEWTIHSVSLLPKPSTLFNCDKNVPVTQDGYKLGKEVEVSDT